MEAAHGRDAPHGAPTSTSLAEDLNRNTQVCQIKSAQCLLTVSRQLSKIQEKMMKCVCTLRSFEQGSTIFWWSDLQQTRWSSVVTFGASRTACCWAHGCR